MHPISPSHRYTILFRTGAGEVSSEQHVIASDDAEAVDLARRRARHGGNNGFEVRYGERIVHAEPMTAPEVSEQSLSSTDMPAPGRWSGSRLGESHVAYLDFAADVERQREAGKALSPVYRIYLREHGGNVVSGHTVAVESDDVAIKVASVLCLACADVSKRFEVWKGEALLTAGHASAPVLSKSNLSQCAQQVVIDTEIALRDSYAALAESRQLLDAIEEWQANGSARTRPLRLTK